MDETVGLISLTLILLTSFFLILSEDWRMSLALLGIQYLGVFWIVLFDWPMVMAAVKFLTGLIVCTLLGIASASLPDSPVVDLKIGNLRNFFYSLIHLPPPKFILGRGFLIITAVLVLITSLSLSTELNPFFKDGNLFVIQSGLILIGIGFLKICFSREAFPIVLGILMSLAGFEVIYSLLDKSVLVAGLLAGANLGIALTGAYLIVSPTLEGHS